MDEMTCKDLGTTLWSPCNPTARHPTDTWCCTLPVGHAAPHYTEGGHRSWNGPAGKITLHMPRTVYTGSTYFVKWRNLIKIGHSKYEDPEARIKNFRQSHPDSEFLFSLWGMQLESWLHNHFEPERRRHRGETELFELSPRLQEFLDNVDYVY